MAKHEKMHMDKKGKEKDDNIPDIVEYAKEQPPGAGEKQGKMSNRVESVFGDDHLDHDAFSDKMTKSLTK